MKLIQIPTHCPVCEYRLELVNDQLFCRNIACEAQVGKKIEHFCKTLKIKGAGPVTVAKLGLEDITQLFYLDEQETVTALGEKLALKLLTEIEKAKESDFATVLASFSIPLVGGTAAAKLATIITNLDDITFEKCKEAGLGDKVSCNLVNWFETEYQEIKEFLPFKFPDSITKPETVRSLVCITGKLKSFATKAEAAQALNAKGYQVTDNLNKTVSFLVDESNKGSSKRQKAEDYGITVVEDLIKFLNT